MKTQLPAFGFISGLTISAVFLPHALVTLAIILLHKAEFRDPTPLLLFFTLTARLGGEWIFWAKFFPMELEKEKSGSSRIRSILFSQPAAIKAMNNIIFDALVDGILLYFALKITDSPMWVLFAYSACQVGGGPIHGVLIRYINISYIRSFSMIVISFAIFLILKVAGIISTGYFNMFGLSHLSSSTQILLIICAKCLLSGVAVIGREVMGETLVLKAEDLGTS